MLVIAINHKKFQGGSAGFTFFQTKTAVLVSSFLVGIQDCEIEVCQDYRI